MAEKNGPVEGKYPAKAHCEKVAQFLRDRGASMNGMIFLEGAREQHWEDSDCEAPFRCVRSSYASCFRADGSYTDNGGTFSTSAASPNPAPPSLTISRPPA